MRPRFAFSGVAVGVAACLILSSLSQAVGQPRDERRDERPQKASTFGQVLAELSNLTGDAHQLRATPDYQPYASDRSGRVEVWRVEILRRITGPEFESEAGNQFFLDNPEFRQFAEATISVSAPAGTGPNMLVHNGWITQDQKISLYKNLRATPLRRDELNKIRDNIKRVEAGESWEDIELEEEEKLPPAIVDEVKRESREFSDDELNELQNDLVTMPEQEAGEYIASGMVQWRRATPQRLRGRVERLERTIGDERTRAREEIEKNKEKDADNPGKGKGEDVE